MTTFKICTFIIFYFMVRLAFSPSTVDQIDSYGDDSRPLTDARIAFVSE
jgi:hypothetical protein